MINTIFYFVNTEAEYQQKLQNNEIKPYTIALAEDTGTIWKNGKRYGGLTRDEVNTALNGTEEDIQNLIDQINQTINEVNQKVDEEKSRLDDVVDGLNNSILTEVESLIDDAQWMLQNWPQSEIQWQDDWNPAIKAYLKQVGLWDYQDGDIITGWSLVKQSVDGITSEVNQIRNHNNDTDTTIESLQSQITQEINDRDEAITNINNTYVKSTDVDGVKTILEWVYSGLKSGASEKKSYAEILSAAQNGDTSAIADLRTSVENINDTYVSKTSLQSAVNDAISGVVNETTEGSAMALMYSKVNANTDNIAAVVTKMTDDSSEASIATKLGNMSGSIVTTANVDDAIAGLSATSKNRVGNAIAATIFAKANEQGSNITLDADNINLNGQTNFENAIGNMITTKGLKIGDVDGEIKTVIENGNATFSGDVIAKTLTAGPSDGMHIVTTGNEIHFMSGDKVMGKFVTEDNGLQMYIMGPDGDLYKVNFSNWTNTKSGGTSTTYRIYRIQGGGTAGYSVINSVDSVYGNNDDVYYANQQGTVLANIGDSSSTGYYLWPSGGGTTTILSVPNTSHTAIYTVVGYKDVYFVDGVMHDGPNRYLTVTTDNGRTYFINGGSQLSGVYSYSVWLAENANQTCADVTEMDFGSGDAYWATVTNTVTPYTSGKLTRVIGGQYGATLEHYTP